MTAPTRMPLQIGWAEVVDFPSVNVVGLVAKIDTGAQTSALAASNIEVLANGHVRFEVAQNVGPSSALHILELPIARRAQVRSSTGHLDERYFVRLLMRLADVEKEIEVSLASRRGLRFVMLVGRNALGRDFVIDAGRRFVATSRRKRLQPRDGENS